MKLRGGVAVFTLLTLIVSVTAHDVTLPRRWLRQSRFFNPVKAVRDWFHGPSASSTDALAHLGKYPVWKVHKYNGISIKPVNVIDVSALPQKSGKPPSVVNVPQPLAPYTNTYEPPTREYGPPSFSSAQSSSNQDLPSEADGEDSAAALSALDNLGSLVNLLPDSEGSSSGGLDLSKLAGLASQIPPEAVEKLQSVLGVYNAKNNQERVNSLISAAVAKTKLTAGALHSLRNLFQGLIGGAGGSKDIAIESGTYHSVPKGYPGKVGVLTDSSLISGPSSGIPLPELPPPPPLPEIPILEKFKSEIKVPPFPHIYLPSKFTLVNKPGKGYVSFQMPPPFSSYSSPAPTNTYGAPKDTEVVQNIPNQQPAQNFNPPQTPYTSPVNSYGVPVQSSYSVPAQDNSFQASNDFYSEAEPSSYQPDSFNQEEFYPFQPDQNEILPSPSERHETIAFPQDQSPSYSRVVMQRGAQPANNVHAQNAVPDIAMYLDPNHPASTQNLSQEQYIEVQKQKAHQQEQQQITADESTARSDIQPSAVRGDNNSENHSSRLSQHRFQPKNPRS